MNHLPCCLATWALAFCLVLVGSASAAEDQMVRSLAANCTGCHGPSGNSLGAIPTIAGREKGYILTVMQEFKAGTRQATVMHQLARGYTDQEIEILAEYFAKQK